MWSVFPATTDGLQRENDDFTMENRLGHMLTTVIISQVGRASPCAPGDRWEGHGIASVGLLTNTDSQSLVKRKLQMDTD